ncbi:uncharacterized protein LOC126895850 [Daktulosphaira vitifoliae]|uniref:uncharacterized protein LOC126895850 n=1 Tax=Daktulosphaira vitifoliae TaxID=58002 RepID=UPI0021A9F4A8|nr:uncharacterized protein LOC126895850 [Daktulosphaira vitifoliae]
MGRIRNMIKMTLGIFITIIVSSQSNTIKFEKLHNWSFMKTDTIEIHNGELISVENYLNNIESSKVTLIYNQLMKNRVYKYVFLLSYYSLLVVYCENCQTNLVRCLVHDLIKVIDSYMRDIYNRVPELTDMLLHLNSTKSDKYAFLCLFNCIASIIEETFNDKLILSIDKKDYVIDTTFSSYENLRTHYKWDLYRSVLSSESKKLSYPPENETSLECLVPVLDDLYNNIKHEYFS